MERRPEFRLPAARLREHLAAGENYVAISRRYDVGEKAVEYRCRKMGLRDRVRGTRPSEEALRLALSHSDIPIKAIARTFGVEAATITRTARSYGIPTDEIGRERMRDAR